MCNIFFADAVVKTLKTRTLLNEKRFSAGMLLEAVMKEIHMSSLPSPLDNLNLKFSVESQIEMVGAAVCCCLQPQQNKFFTYFYCR